MSHITDITHISLWMNYLINFKTTCVVEILLVKLLCNFIEIGFRHGCSQNTYSHNIFYYEHFGGLLLYFWGPHRSVTLHYTQDIIHTSGTYQYKGLPLFSLEWFSLIKWLSVPEQNTDNKGKNKVLRVLYSHLRKPVEI